MHICNSPCHDPLRSLATISQLRSFKLTSCSFCSKTRRNSGSSAVRPLRRAISLHLRRPASTPLSSFSSSSSYSVSSKYTAPSTSHSLSLADVQHRPARVPCPLELTRYLAGIQILHSFWDRIYWRCKSLPLSSAVSEAEPKSVISSMSPLLTCRRRFNSSTLRHGILKPKAVTRRNFSRCA